MTVSLYSEVQKRRCPERDSNPRDPIRCRHVDVSPRIHAAVRNFDSLCTSPSLILTPGPVQNTAVTAPLTQKLDHIQ